MYGDKDFMVTTTFAGDSGLPEDSFVNTWAVKSAALVLDPDWGFVADAFEDFFFTESDGAVTGRLGSYMSRELGNKFTFKAYRLTDAEPRVPVFERVIDSPSPFGTTALPTEVAIALSFQGERVSGEDQASRRGRVFLGPWSASSVIMSDVTGRPLPFFCSLIGQCANRLKNALAGGTPGVIWCVNSRKNSALVPVEDGWVDNAWDTQRRRGLRPTVRTSWE